ncbi:FAD:protein FMN transferase [Pseudothermotoga thermarum]|uniref:FAD:protein FMN transferase n=1 Tax=Pseudothermotoga thermarum DSM 5069 TaxID=688269 RepID=F7YY86_9THEM|nr:FAD:protein FMN transferase [Pseudothermotoga thermarum]AEH50907.1 ApbE family lipoprotein [Pseudothermotoga thermarum DSM 5069]
MPKKDSKDFIKINRTLFWIFLLGLTFAVAFLIRIFFNSQKTLYYELNGFTMGTYYRIVVASSKVESKQLAEIIFKELDRIYKKYNPKDPESVVWKINSSNDWVDLDEETFVIVDSALKFAELTNGAFDPALGTLISLWGFDRLDEKIPSKIPPDEAIKKALEQSGYKNVELDGRTRRIRLHNNVKLDLGGIVKGYALDRAYQIAKEIDPSCTGFIEVGGDIRILGPKFGSRPWVVGVRDPFSPSKAVTYFYMTSGAVATSGDYERYFVYENKKYHHIIDPKTGYPAQGVTSATVISEDAITADALSTAAFVSGADWEYVILEYPKIGGIVLLISHDGTVKKSSAIKAYEKR